MWKREAARICDEMEETGEAMAQALQVSPELLDGFQVHVFGMAVERRGRQVVASFDSEDPGPPLPDEVGWRSKLTDYRKSMIEMGLPVPRVGGGDTPDMWTRGYPDAEDLTRDFMWGAQALRRLGAMSERRTPDKKLAPTVKGLAQAFVATVVERPEALLLPSDHYVDEDTREGLGGSYTRSQAEGLDRLRPYWQRGVAARAEAIVDAGDTLPEIDTDKWTDQLRRRLRMYTPAEIDAIDDLLARAASGPFLELDAGEDDLE